MTRPRLWESVVIRLVASLIVGGVVLSFGLAALEFRRSEKLLRIETTQQVALMARNLQAVIRPAASHRSAAQIHDALSYCLTDPLIRAARLSREPQSRIEVGDWPARGEPAAAIWTLPERGVPQGGDISLQRPTIVRAPLIENGRVLTVELLVDGPAAQKQLLTNVGNALAMQGLLLAVLTLLGLLLLRRWFAGPLSDVVEQIGSGAGAESFHKLAQQQRGEFAQLAQAIGGMLARIDATAQRLRQREKAFVDLYQFAPAAMVSLDVQGKISEANRRAAHLLAATDEQALIGRSILDFIRTEDRALLRQTIDRLDLDHASRCELRVGNGDHTHDTLVECAGVRDDEGALCQIRLSLQDVSQAKQLHRQLADQSRLLNLVIDHMSDAILLVDREGRIVAHNQRLTVLLHKQAEQLRGAPYDPQYFWDELGVVDQEKFNNRMKQLLVEAEKPAQERFATRAGTFLFEGIPVHDATAQLIGRLWVVQEITHQDQVQKLLNQQTAQLQALRQVGQRLADVADVSDLLEKGGQLLYEVFGVETLGLAIRRDHRGGRSQQILHRGTGPVLLPSSQALVEAVGKYLLPQVLASSDVLFWPDPPANLPWSKAFNQAGLTCVAAAPLRGSSDAQGILWMARRGGERMDRQHIYLLQAMAPVIAARLEFALQRERLQRLHVTDLVTDLPNAQQFADMVQKLVNRPGYPWSVVLIKLDQFRRLNELIEHAAADRLLRNVATDLQRALRKSCFVARLAGPTFGILCPDMGWEPTQKLALRLQQVLTAHHIPLADGAAWNLTATLSLACSPDDGRTGQEVIDAVTRRLENAKATGGNRLVDHDSPLEKQAG